MRILILLFFIPLITFSQNFKTNFTVSDNQIQWQKVYESSKTDADVDLHIKKKGADTFTEFGIVNFTVNFDSEHLKPYGFQSSSFPTYIQLGGTYKGFIEFKEGRYRVTVSEIQVVNALDPNLSFNIGEYVLKRRAINPKKHHIKTLEMLDAYFEGMFNPENIKQDTW